MISLIINLVVFFVTLFAQLFFYIAEGVITLLAYIFGGSMELLAKRMKEKRPGFKKKGGLFKKNKSIYNTISDALNDISKTAEARNIGIYRAAENKDENINFEIDHDKMRNFLVSSANLSFTLSPVSISMYCTPSGLGYQFGVHAMNVAVDQETVNSLSYTSTAYETLNSLASELGAIFNIECVVNDVYIYAYLPASK